MGLELSPLLEAPVLPLPHDHVIEKGNPEKLPGFPETLREIEVFLRRIRIPGGVVVRDEDGSGGKSDGHLEHLPGMDDGRVQRPHGDELDGEDVVPGVQVDGVEPFPVRVLDEGSDEVVGGLGFWISWGSLRRRLLRTVETV